MSESKEKCLTSVDEAIIIRFLFNKYNTYIIRKIHKLSRFFKIKYYISMPKLGFFPFHHYNIYVVGIK
jgi:hypothetical protein